MLSWGFRVFPLSPGCSRDSCWHPRRQKNREKQRQVVHSLHKRNSTGKTILRSSARERETVSVRSTQVQVHVCQLCIIEIVQLTSKREGEKDFNRTVLLFSRRSTTNTTADDDVFSTVKRERERQLNFFLSLLRSVPSPTIVFLFLSIRDSTMPNQSLSLLLSLIELGKCMAINRLNSSLSIKYLDFHHEFISCLISYVERKQYFSDQRLRRHRQSSFLACSSLWRTIACIPFLCRLISHWRDTCSLHLHWRTPVCVCVFFSMRVSLHIFEANLNLAQQKNVLDVVVVVLLPVRVSERLSSESWQLSIDWRTRRRRWDFSSYYLHLSTIDLEERGRERQSILSCLIHSHYRIREDTTDWSCTRFGSPPLSLSLSLSIT